jgi:hypothetical protein
MTKIQFSIVKNNDFATIGFHVYFGNHRTFTWGIADEPSLYYVKKQDANEESMEKILELMNWKWNTEPVKILFGISLKPPRRTALM